MEEIGKKEGEPTEKSKDAPEEKAQEEPEKEPEPEEKKEEAGEKKAEDKVDKEPEDKPEADEGKKKRTPKVMNIYEHEIAKGKWEKKEKALLSDIADLKTEAGKKNTAADREKAIDAYCEKHGMERDQVEGLINIIGTNQGTDENLKTKVEELETQAKNKKEDLDFDEEFSKEVTPLFEKDNIEAKHQVAVKKLIHDLAFTEKYVSYDLDDIYLKLKNKGKLDDFIKQPGKKSGETSGGGTSTKTGEPDTEKSFKDMTDKEFEDFGDNEASKEKRHGTVRRDGKEIRI